MNSLFAIIATCAFFVATSWPLTYLLPTKQKSESLGLSLLLGSGLTTWIWFVGFRLGLPLTLATLLLSGLLLMGLGHLLARRTQKLPTQVSHKKFTPSEKLLAGLLIGVLGAAFVIGWYHPLTAWDSLAQYDFRGHAIAVDHDLSFVRTGAYSLSYPLMISLVHAVVYMLGGTSAQSIHALIFAAFLAIVYGRMKIWTNRKYALLTCLLISGQNEILYHATVAYTNLPYTAYLVTGLLYSVSGGSLTILVAGLLLGISGWVRSSEVFWLIGLGLLYIQAWRMKKIPLAMIVTLGVLGMRSTWSTYVAMMFRQINFVAGSTLSHVSLASLHKIVTNWQEIYWYLYLNVISPYLGIWVLSVPIWLISYMRRNRRLGLLALAILCSAGMVVGGVMLFSTYYPGWNEIGDSARRMMLFVIPLTLIASMYALYTISHKKTHAA